MRRRGRRPQVAESTAIDVEPEPLVPVGAADTRELGNQVEEVRDLARHDRHHAADGARSFDERSSFQLASFRRGCPPDRLTWPRPEPTTGIDAGAGTQAAGRSCDACPVAAGPAFQ